MATDLTKQQLMFSLIEIWRKEGKTQQEFCKEKELDYHQFQYWLRRYKQSHEPEQVQPGFTQVKLMPQSLNTASMELIFPDGRKLVFHQPVDATFLRNLLH